MASEIRKQIKDTMKATDGVAKLQEAATQNNFENFFIGVMELMKKPEKYNTTEQMDKLDNIIKTAQIQTETFRKFLNKTGIKAIDTNEMKEMLKKEEELKKLQE